MKQQNFSTLFPKLSLGIFILILVLQSSPVAAQKTWTGALSSDWANASNWNGGLPSENDAVIIANTGQAPVIGAAVNVSVLSLWVQPQASLSIAGTGSLTISGKASYSSPFVLTASLNNQGTVTNNGEILISTSSEKAQYGILNQGTFLNSGAALIKINNTDDTGLFNASGNFTNSASLVVGDVANVGYHGIWNDGTLTNNSGGNIAIDGASLRGIVNNSGTMTLAGSVLIGKNRQVGTNAVENRASLSIEACGNLLAFKGNFANLTDKTVVNKGFIKIQEVLDNSGSFTNEGIINYGALTGSVTNKELIVKNGTPIFVTGSASSASVSGIYQDDQGLVSAGTFVSPNSFTPDPSLGSSLHTLYAKVNLGSCVYLVSFLYQKPAGGASAQTTWNGNISTDWMNPSNWSNGVPDASYQVIIPGIVSNRPIIASGQAAIANTVNVQSQGVLNLDAGASLTVKAFGSYTNTEAFTAAFFNQGTIYNSGTIVVGELTTAGAYGIYNSGVIKNNQGTIQIDYSTETALYISSAGELTNDGTVLIGQRASVGSTGIWNDKTLINSGNITIDQTTGTALLNNYVFNLLSATLTNTGNILIGQNSAVGVYGLYNKSTMTNGQPGVVRVDRWTTTGISNERILSSQGEIVAGENTDSANYGLINSGQLDNEDCGKLRVFKGSAQNSGRLANSGFLFIAASFVNERQASNSGVASIGDNSFEVNFTNTGVFVQNNKRPIFRYADSPSPSITINGIFKDQAASESAGTFSAPNTFVPYQSSDQTRTLYASVSTGSGQCSFIVPFQYAPDAPDMSVKGRNIVIADGAVTPTIQDDTEFGSVLSVSGTVVRTFTISNNGDASLALSGTPRVAILGSGDFTVTSMPESSVNASQSTSFEITFDPSSPGVKTAQVSIANNDSKKNPYTFTVQGTGLDGCVDSPAAGTITWNGSKDSDWNNLCNWTPTTIPKIGNNVVIPVTDHDPVIKPGTDAVVNSVQVQNGVTLGIDAGGSLSVYGSVLVNGTNTSFYNDGAVLNSGALTLGNSALTNTYGLLNKGSFTNLVCSQLYFPLPVNNQGDFINRGWTLIETTAAHSNGGSFTNEGILSYTLGNAVTGQTNSQLIINPSPETSSCGSLSNAFDLAPGASLKITGIYKGSSGVQSAGNYDQATNVFTPSGFEQGEYKLYVKIEDQLNGCTRFVPWKVVFTRCCIPPVFSPPTVVQPAYPVVTGSITVNTSSQQTVQYSITNGNSWSDNPVFSGVVPGSYLLKARIGDFADCQSTYQNNPVVIAAYTTSVDIWTGQVSDQWNINGNWQDGSAPTSSDDVVIPNTARAAVIGSGTAAAVKSVFVQKDGSLNIQPQGSLLINGSSNYPSLESGVSPFNFTAGLNNLGFFDNKGSLTLISSSIPTTYCIVNQGILLNSEGGQISADQSEDTGIFNALGSLTNNGTILIGAAHNIGNHGIWNDAMLTNNGLIKIDRSTLRALMNNADQTKSVSGTVDNQGQIMIGTNASVGKTGIENLAAFNNKTGGDIQVNSASESAVYHASGLFVNDGQISIGNTGSAGTLGIVSWDNFDNKPTAQIQINNLLGVGIRNQAGSLDNQGKITIGNTVSGGRTGIENSSEINNTDGGEIKIYATRDAAVHHINGTFNNAALIKIEVTSAYGGNGLWTESAFDNSAEGIMQIDVNSSGIAIVHSGALLENHGTISIGSDVAARTGVSISKGAQFENQKGATLQVDRCFTSGIDIANGTVNNYGQIKLGSNASVGNYGLQNQGTFNNKLNADGSRAELRIDRTFAGGIYGPGTIINEADIILGETAEIGKNGFESVGSFTNQKDGLVQIDRTSLSALEAGASFINVGTLNIGSRAASGRYGIFNRGAFQNLQEGNLSIDNTTGVGIYQAQAGTSFTNKGTLTLGAQASTGKVGIENHTSFSNLEDGTIAIDNTADEAILSAEGTFANEAKIQIGLQSSVGTYGIVNRASFNNKAGGVISIARSTDTGLYSSQGSFTNQAEIIIGAQAAVGVHGIFNEATFLNTATGKLTVDRTTLAGVRNFNGSFTNAGAVVLGKTSAVGSFGIYNQAAFENSAHAAVQVDRADAGIQLGAGTFTNSGDVTIGKLSAMATLIGQQDGTFINKTDGTLYGTGNVTAVNFLHDHGSLSPGYSPGKMTFSGDRNLDGSILNMEINGAAAAGVDYDQIEVLGNATLGGDLNITVGYTPANGDEVILFRANAISGTFASVTGNPGWKIDYSSGNSVKLVYDATLPVSLVSFDATKLDKDLVKLSWQTTSETGNQGFFVERSSDALNWKDLGFLSGKGTSSALNKYDFIDKAPMTGLNYYRLRQLDLDGKTHYSRIRAVSYAAPVVEPVVWADETRQAHIQTEYLIRQIRVFDLSGRLVAEPKASSFSLANVQRGVFLIQINTANGVFVKKLLVWR